MLHVLPPLKCFTPLCSTSPQMYLRSYNFLQKSLLKLHHPHCSFFPYTFYEKLVPPSPRTLEVALLYSDLTTGFVEFFMFSLQNHFSFSNFGGFGLACHSDLKKKLEDELLNLDEKERKQYKRIDNRNK